MTSKTISIAGLMFSMALLFTLAAQGAQEDTFLVLVQAATVEQRMELASMDLSLYARYEGVAAVEASARQLDLLDERGFEWTIVDRNPQDHDYYLLLVDEENIELLKKGVTVLDQRQSTLLMRSSPAEAEEVSRYGYGLTRLFRQPFPEERRKPPARPRSTATDEGAFLQSILDNVSQAEITATIRRLQNFETRYSCTDSCLAAAAYLFNRLTGFGLSVSYDFFQYNGDKCSGQTWRNVVAVHPGRTDPERIYVLCGHYDSINNHGNPWTVAPGADDNGSGAAAVVEAARVLNAYDFDASIYFICFSGEEQGYLGSTHYAQWAEDQGLDIRGLINLDMIAYVGDPPYHTWDINIYCDDVSHGLALFVADMMDQHTSAVPYIVNTHLSQPGGDHYPFALKLYEAIFCIDAQFLSAPDWNPYYHSAGDTVGTLNLPYAKNVVKGAVASMANLAGPIGAGDVQKPTMETIGEPRGQYYSHVPVLSNFGFDDNIALDDGWYQIDSFEGTWTVLFANVSGTSWDHDGWTVPGFSLLEDGRYTLYFKAKDDAGNIDGEEGQWSWQFYKDTTPPKVPLISSSTHPDEGLWYAAGAVTVNWIEPYDLSGVIGYSFLLDQNPFTVPDETRDGTALEQSYTDLADGVYYFHCRAGDDVCLWGAAGHFRIRIDTESPSAPVELHVEPSDWSNHPAFSVQWINPQDRSGISGAYYKLDTPPAFDLDGTFIQDNPHLLVTDQEGSRPVFLWLRDGAGNMAFTTCDSASLRYDATAPVQGSISIASGADTASTVVVTLTGLSAADGLSGMGPGAMMQFSNDGLTWAPAQAYDSIRVAWDLSAWGGSGGSGLKTVSVQYRDVAGNWSEVFSDDIVCSLPLKILTQALPRGTVGFAYTCSLSAGGGWPPYGWQVLSGALPRGLALDSTGIISGLPDSAGVSLFEVVVTDTVMNTRQIQLSIPIEEHRCGDVNGDGEVDIIDVVMAVNIILELIEPTSAQKWGADFNSDTLVNILDTVFIVSIILEGP